MSATMEFDEIQEGLVQRVGPYHVAADEIIEFAKKWDPRAIHIDLEAAEAGPFKGLTASSSYTLAVRPLLIQRLSPSTPSLVATMGWQDLKLAAPVRPGDELSLTLTWLDKRVSRSKPNFGIFRQQITMEKSDGTVVLTYVDTVGMVIDATA